MGNTSERINNSTIRIENGKLVGLSVCKQSIDIDALDKLLDAIGKSGIVSTISDVISAIAQIQAECSFCDESDNNELKEFVNEQIRQTLRSIDAFNLNMILKTFNK